MKNPARRYINLFPTTSGAYPVYPTTSVLT